MLINPTLTLLALALPLLWMAIESCEGESFSGDEAGDEEYERDGLYDDDLWRGP
jgi:hypothetical protein